LENTALVYAIWRTLLDMANKQTFVCADMGSVQIWLGTNRSKRHDPSEFGHEGYSS
jgi:hypothetical protein